VPELPEVETIVRALAPRLVGRRIVAARFTSKLVLRGRAAPPVAGKTIAGVSRYGKFIVFDLDGDGPRLLVHLGMTGKLLVDAEPTPYTRAVFRLGKGTLLFDDIRQFGRIELAGALPALGPDPLELRAGEFSRMLRERRGRIKPLLLNQRFLRGLGNIYADEALFRARVHPLADASRLGKRAPELHRAIVAVLRAAIEKGGSSIANYVDAEGRRGSFQLLHRVYGKAGRPCPRCGAAIRRIVVAQRGTHYCPECQRT